VSHLLNKYLKTAMALNAYIFLKWDCVDKNLLENNKWSNRQGKLLPNHCKKEAEALKKRNLFKILLVSYVHLFFQKRVLTTLINKGKAE